MTPATAGAMTAGERKLSDEDFADFERLETVVRKGIKTFVDVGLALMEIRDRKLYKEICSTFEAYVQIRFEFSRQRAHQLIGAASVVSSLSTVVDVLPDSERVARPLAALPESERPAVWTEAVESSGGKPTAKDVKRAARELREMRRARIVPRDSNGSVPDVVGGKTPPLQMIEDKRGGDDTAPSGDAEDQTLSGQPTRSMFFGTTRDVALHLIELFHPDDGPHFTLSESELLKISTRDLTGLRRIRFFINRVLKAHGKTR